MAKKTKVVKKKFVPSSDKEIASVYIQNEINILITNLVGDEDADEEFDVYADLKEIADKNLRENRLDKIVDRIIERLEKLRAPVDKYLDNKE